MISFIAAVYNEEDEIVDLLTHVAPYVDGIYIADDGSTDGTKSWLYDMSSRLEKSGLSTTLKYHEFPHIGLPETVKNLALQMVPDDSWVLMLDADERFITPIPEIIEWIKSSASEKVDYVYFEQFEVIDGIHVRTFQKCKLFRKESITFPTGIHEDDRFEGHGEYFGWQVLHRKGSSKQIQREIEYLDTYKRLLEEGKIDQGRYEWLRGLHHYIRD